MLCLIVVTFLLNYIIVANLTISMYLHYSFHLFVSALFSFRLLLVFNFNTNFILDCENLGFFLEDDCFDLCTSVF